jgi:phenylacetate-CoA ligase
MIAIKTLIKTMPAPVQTCARYAYGAIPHSIRAGKTYRRMYDFLQESQWWSRERLDAYQMDRLSKILRHAYANVPYYRRIFDERGLKPTDIKCLDDLRLLPFLTRDIIRENLSDLVAHNHPQSRLQYETTGGSTGIPLGFYFERGVTDQIEQAFIHSLWNRVGFKPGHKSAIFRGKLIRDGRWQYDQVLNNLYFSTFDMDDETLARYVDQIRKFNPDYIAGYPSAISVLAGFMIRNRILPFSSVRAVLCGSENLYPNLREQLWKAFTCRIYSWYGHTERAVLAGECEQGPLYHIFPEYGIFELAGNEGAIITTAGKPGEVVATGLNNFAFPLVRYRTGDIAVRSGKSCSCGREYQLLERVDGRLQDFIITRDHHKITLTAFIFAQHFAAFSRIKQMQIIQERPGAIKVRISRLPEYARPDEDELRRVMLSTVKGQLEIGFEYVDKIEKTSGGKHQFLIQKLPIKSGVKNV